MSKQQQQALPQILSNLGFDELNPMQERMLEICRTKNEVLLLAPTGSGKTVSFLLPVTGKIKNNISGVQILILVPTRELALQIEQVFRTMGTGNKVNCCYGGHPMKIEKNNFTVPPTLLIGTPGRIAAHLQRGSFDPDTIHTLVLDEFDKSLEMGFQDDMSFILKNLRHLRMKILTSATQSIEIPDFTGLKNPERLDFHQGDNLPNLEIKVVRADENDKLEKLFQLICHLGSEPTLVFCNHREAVDRISDLLLDKGIVHETFHGGLEQADRERALIKFRNGSHHLLITTDLAARGLDIPEIKNIIHYQTAPGEAAFIHRNGRTARMNASGTVWLVLAETEPLPPFIDEQPELVNITEPLSLPQMPLWQTIYLGGGKKDKINKIDIVGFLIHKGGLNKEEIGLISVLDFESFVAIHRNKIKPLLRLLKDEKIKNRKLKIALSE